MSYSEMPRPLPSVVKARKHPAPTGDSQARPTQEQPEATAMRSAETQARPTSLQWALIVVALVIVLLGALWPSSNNREPGLFGVAGRPASAPGHAAEVVPRAGTATSSVQLRMAPSQKPQRVRRADCHPPRLQNQARAEC